MPFVKVGIALAAYQPDLEVFAQQLLSIQKQSHTDWICVIALDSPLDPVLSSRLITPFQADARFHWVENKIRLGHKKNFEKAIQESLRHSVSVIACSDQDDVWYENKLSECLRAFSTQGPLSLVHSDMHILENEKIASKTAWALERRGIHNCKPRHFYVRNIVAGCSMLFDAELARRFPTIPEEAEFHDHWYALVASYHGGIRAIHQPLYAYRQHPENEVGVSPYRKLFTLPAGSTFAEILNKCKNGWRKSLRLASAAQREGLPLSIWERITFLSRLDLGFGLLLLAIMNWKSDRPLTRACLARSIGKALTTDSDTH